MSRFAETVLNNRCSRKEDIPEEFSAWSRIEVLGNVCGYDVDEQLSDLMELMDTYPVLRGRNAEELAEEHPLRALAMLVRRFLEDYPETAEMMAAGTADPAPAFGRQGPERAA